MTTGELVVAEIDALYSDSANSIWKAAQKLAAVNAAISGAWPHVRNVGVDTSITLDGDTDEYSPTAVPEREYGFAEAYVVSNITNNPDVLLRRVSQYWNGTAWKVVVPRDLARLYDAKGLKLRYNSRHARIATLADTINIDIEYLRMATTYHLLAARVLTGADNDIKPFAEMLPEMRQERDKWLIANRSNHLPHIIPIVTEAGQARSFDYESGRYNV